MKLFNKILLLMNSSLILMACASGVEKYKNLEHAVPHDQPVRVNKLEVVLSEEAQEKLEDNAKFNIEDFEDKIENTLSAAGYLHDKADNLLKIEITDIRVRSHFSAAMFGAFAGSDSIEGKVFVKNPENETIRAFNVSADYALGGLVAGDDAVRLDWLYEEFAQLSLKELKGEASKQ